MLPALAALLALIPAAPAIARPGHDLFDATLSVFPRQNISSMARKCAATCKASMAMNGACGEDPQMPCGCSDRQFQAAGDCFACAKEIETPRDAAMVQLLWEVKVDGCHREGIPVHFQLDLPLDAQTIVDEFHHQISGRIRQQTVFLALQIAGGHIGLVLVLAFAIFSRKVHRDLIFFNFCITWIFSSIVYSILLYRRTKWNTPISMLGRVPGATCVIQAALINGVQPMTTCSTTTLVVQLWIRLRTAIYVNPAGEKEKRWTTFALLMSPYALFLAFAVSSFIVIRTLVQVRSSTQILTPTNFYCSIVDFNPFSRAVYGVTLGLLIVTVIFKALIVMSMYRHWWACRHAKMKSPVSLSILFRVFVFGMYRVIVAIAYGTALNTSPQSRHHLSADTLSVWVDMLQAAIPLFAFIILGTNTEMLDTLMFWRRNRRAVLTFSMTHQINTATSRGVSTVNNNSNSPWGERAFIDADTTHGVSDKV